ncbi:MAG: hypothetical protein DCC57_11630 [Chloroflexi bacterium]|nr:MAG: hypothetical protein DCC57_11630 [Chloroflexota bacterium]
MSSRKNENTGLGKNAFFKTGKGNASDPQEATGTEEKVAKMRTSVMLSPEVVAGIEILRTQARKQGQRLTTSEIIDDALRLLMRERKVMP